jgi:hypothetical protein
MAGLHRGVAAPGGEASRRYLPDDYRQGWLAFESGARKLRLAPIPAGWGDTTRTRNSASS